MNTAAERAQRLLRIATEVGSALSLVEEMAREGAAVINQEPAAADTVLLQGEEVMVALKRMAMALDRGAYASQEVR